VTNDDQTIAVEVLGNIPQAELLYRQAPASQEGDPRAWDLAETVVDYAAYLLQEFASLRAGREVRDLTTAALMRRAIITCEGVRRLISLGLEEPAVELLRTLVEIDLNLRLLTADATDRMAKRLAAHHYRATQRQGTKMLSHPPTRARLGGPAADFSWVTAVTRQQKEFFESTNFDEVRAELAGDQHWHGYKSIEDAFEALGMSSDYLQLYSIFSPYVHATNLDVDFDGIDDGRPLLRSLVQRDPSRTLTTLGHAVIALVQIAELFVADRQIVDDKYPSRVRNPATGEEFEVPAMSAVQALLASTFDPELIRRPNFEPDSAEPGK
jgi:hypothetical protein